MAGATLLALLPASASAAAGPTITIRIEGVKKTLLVPTADHGESGFLTKFGAPGGKCPGASAQGALDVATHGHWVGSWNTQFNEYFISSILGEKPTGSDFWEIFVNNKAAQVGACDLKLHAGEQLLFADESGKLNPSSLTAPRSAVAGRSFRVKLVGYNAMGKSKPLAGVTITGTGVKTVKTDRQGLATITDDHRGVLVLRASPKGDVRTESVVHVVP